MVSPGVDFPENLKKILKTSTQLIPQLMGFFVEVDKQIPMVFFFQLMENNHLEIVDLPMKNI